MFNFACIYMYIREDVCLYHIFLKRTNRTSTVIIGTLYVSHLYFSYLLICHLYEILYAPSLSTGNVCVCIDLKRVLPSRYYVIQSKSMSKRSQRIGCVERRDPRESVCCQKQSRNAYSTREKKPYRKYTYAGLVLGLDAYS